MTRKEQIIDVFWKSLVGFGYENLTREETEEAIRLALSDNVEGDVIAMFIHGWLNGEFSALKPECEQLFREGEKHD